MFPLITLQSVTSLVLLFFYFKDPISNFSNMSTRIRPRHILLNDPQLEDVYNNKPMIYFKKGRNIKDRTVKAVQHISHEFKTVTD